MSVASRIAAALLVMVLLLGFSAWWILDVSTRLESQNRSLAEVDVEALALGLQALGRLGELDELTEKYTLLGDERYREEASRVAGDIDLDLRSLGTLELSAEERVELERLSELWSAARPGSDGVAASTSIKLVRDRLAAFIRSARAQMRLTADESSAEVERARSVAWGVAVAALVLAVGLGAILGRSVVEPLRRLGRATRRLAAGDFSARVSNRGPREIAGLADDFNAMAHEVGRLDELKRDLVSNVSHDLKAPLASMQETTRLLLDQVSGDLNEQQQRLLSLNLASGERLSQMLENVLDLSRLDAGAAIVRAQRLGVGGLLRGVRSELAAFAESQRVDVSVTADDGLTIVADEDLMRRALVNVVQNAIKFSPHGERVVVGASSAGSEVLITVVDRGPGVPEADKERIFDRFHRASPARRGVRGSGLGLAISRAIMGAHGGRIWVEDGDGGGSRFCLQLPATSTLDLSSFDDPREDRAASRVSRPMGATHA